MSGVYAKSANTCSLKNLLELLGRTTCMFLGHAGEAGGGGGLLPFSTPNGNQCGVPGRLHSLGGVPWLALLQLDLLAAFILTKGTFFI